MPVGMGAIQNVNLRFSDLKEDQVYLMALSTTNGVSVGTYRVIAISPPDCAVIRKINAGKQEMWNFADILDFRVA